MILSSVFITGSYTKSSKFRCSFINDVGEGLNISIVFFQTS